jgi:hypothetical protein
MKLILIDSRVKSLNTFINALKEDVEYVAYDFKTDTYESIKSVITIKNLFIVFY